MSKDHRFEIRLNPERMQRLQKWSEKTGKTRADIIRYLMDLAEKYNLLDYDWKERLFEENLALHEKKKEIDAEYEVLTYVKRRKVDQKMKEAEFARHEQSKERDRQLKIALSLKDDYFATLTDPEKKNYFAREFHFQRALSSDDPNQLPAKVNGGYEIYLNGVRLVVPELLKNGMPKLEYNQELCVPCEHPQGFHTKGSKCYRCPQRVGCPTLIDEGLQGIARR